MDTRLCPARFPRSAGYHPDWMVASCSGGANALWLTEWLTEALDLRPGMRVLDLGCGRAMSSVFLRREFGVQVWATDLWFSPTENLRRVRDAGVADGVFPLRADARALPFADEFFDAIVSVDSFMYYGTDDLYMNALARLVKPGGQIGIAQVGLAEEFDGDVPEHLREWWDQDRPGFFHTAAWWRRHWDKSGVVNVESADRLTDGWQYWRGWLRVVAPQNTVEIAAVEADAGRNLGFARVVGRRRADAVIPDPVVSIPTQYELKPLRREG